MKCVKFEDVGYVAKIKLYYFASIGFALGGCVMSISSLGHRFMRPLVFTFFLCFSGTGHSIDTYLVTARSMSTKTIAVTFTLVSDTHRAAIDIAIRKLYALSYDLRDTCFSLTLQ